MQLMRPIILALAIFCAVPLFALRDTDPQAPHPPALDAEVAAPRVPALLRHAAENAPHDITTLIVARDLATVRKTPACASLISIVESLELFPSSRRAWHALARQLDLPPEQAFDALLGEHAIFMTHDDPDTGASWALTSRVSIASAKRLGAALGATPRSQLAGLPVYSMENGAFVLHIRSDKRDNSAWITIGPGDHPDLFRRLLDPPADAKARSLATDARFNDLIAALPEAADAYVYRRLAPDEPDFAVGAVRLAKDSLITTYAAFTSGPVQDQPPGWSRVAFEALSQRSALTVVESGRTSAGRFLEVASDSTLGPIKALASLFQPFPQRDLIESRTAFTIRNAPGGNLGVAYAIAAPDTRALVPAADQYMAAQLAALFPKSINAEQRIDTEGLVPEATRTVSLRGTGVAGIFRYKDAATFAWSVTPAAHPDNTDKTPGWWAAGINPDTIERTAKVLTAANEPGQWAALAEARPADLAALLENTAFLPIPLANTAVMRRIERITLSERRLAPEKVVGSVSIDFLPPPQPPAPPAPGG